MSDRLPDLARTPAHPATSYVTLAGADWLASAGPHPDDLHAQWALHPDAPSVLPCGTAFDVINAPALFGRRMVDRLWSAGPGSGPVAAHRGRILLFAAPGTAQRLPALLVWEEWAAAVPPLLCHGTGDAVTIPPLHPHPAPAARTRPRGAPQSIIAPADDDTVAGSRWLVAPDVRRPWLPGPDVLLWACVRAARPAAREAAAAAGEAAGQPRVSALAQAPGKPIFVLPDQDANVFPVSRRR
ncbi:hypothetical protein ACFY0R_21380 [Streptomyces sp. NPDC001633]|uniref:hypothetical protein n=1 Tax=Streptomyces sp. NPDC001633 TaxID=3364595 RepID=UPI00369F5EFA